MKHWLIFIVYLIIFVGGIIYWNYQRDAGYVCTYGTGTDGEWVLCVADEGAGWLSVMFTVDVGGLTIGVEEESR